MPLYRSRIFDLSPSDGPPSPYVGRGWHVTPRPLKVMDTPARPSWKEATRVHHITSIIASEGISARKIKHTYAPELIIEAESRLKAQNVLNMITAAQTLL